MQCLQNVRNLACSVVLISVSTFVCAQDLERSRTLVETWRSDLLPDTLSTVFIEVEQESLDRTLSVNQFYDFEQQLVHTESNNSVTGSNYAFYQNGKMSLEASFSQSLTDQEVTGQAESMAIMLRELLGEFRILLPETYEVISYDGLVQYGDLARGEQVTLRFKDILKGNAQVTRSFIFTEDGELAATFEQRQEPELIVYDLFSMGDDYLRVTYTIYVSRQGQAVRISDIREDYFFNRSLERTSFADN